MNQHQLDNLPPPPPRSSNANTPNGPPFATQQRRPVSMIVQQPPAITTNIARALGAPLSAHTLAPPAPHPFSPATPSALNPHSPGGLGPNSTVSARTMEPYNPRQWSNRGGQVSGTQMLFQQRSSNVPPSTRDVSGMEGAMPSPPPPYSPETPESLGRAVRASPLLLDTTSLTASPIVGNNSVTNSPQVPMSPAFPPPPGQSSRHRERSTSGIANTRGFFGLSGLRGKSTTYTELPTRNSVHLPEVSEPHPPAARRAASTGHIQSSSTLSIATPSGSGAAGRGSPDNSWQPGMPLPGPPPGPPPPGMRSQSLNRYPPTSRSNSQTSEHSLDVQQSRRLATRSTLGPIPPTPADWVDTDALPRQFVVSPIDTTDQDYQPLRIDTGSHQDAALSRRPAQRDSSGQGLRERRSRSRAKDRNSKVISPMSDDGKPFDALFATSEGSISRRREHMRTISGYVSPSAASRPTSSREAQTTTQGALPSASNVLTPPYTPAIGKPEGNAIKTQPLKVPGSASSDRPISHILHQPIAESSSMPAPLTPSRPASSGSAMAPAKLDAFFLQSIERHRAFVEKEAAAASDEERLELFANFMVHESRLRRDRYPAAYNTLAGDIMDLTRDMWRSYARQGKRAPTPSTSMSSYDATAPSWGSDGQPASAHANMPSSASSFGEYTPATDAASAYDTMENTGPERPDSRQWGEAFKPSLSPIPSMNVSTVPEESSSRGRTASRWWEASNSGSGSIGKPERIEKTHRETKYMGISPALLHDKGEDSPQSALYAGPASGPSTGSFGYRPNEYPPEKTGWHEGADFETPIATPSHPRNASASDVQLLDVSRLVTLPPPYPRHYPALNNKHPLLSDLRSEHRALVNNSKIQEIKDAYLDQDYAIQREQHDAAIERRAKLRSSIQAKVADGSISYAEAAQAEADFDNEEAERGKANARSNFDLFEANAAHPLNALIGERLAKANAAIDQLQAELDSRNEVSDPNQAQEEGDEQPERLEKLTLLKWVFEAREQVHKEMFELHADRSAKYSEVILTPFRVAKMQAKVDEAAAFFAKDNQDRHINFAKDSLKRFEELQRTMEQNVSRGVEDQLSAFWDIAPGLLELVQQFPNDISTLDIQIPEQEYNENPSYNDHPLQYLYSLLSHAQRSAYQFIESQTNLLCLLHEVRTATTKSRLRLLELERSAANPRDEGVRAEMAEARQAQEQWLTNDLKEKVGEVERQWGEALGGVLEDVRRRVREDLEAKGGWEDGLEE
ncbi:uncharacterized protein LTR77_001318 [Saxophila tyrrhenica]|uniref:Uncharacterized protein n=1 Tax=Saxophila tyrrhenica TaxID=1690608 RepID=A0AAV9PK59_9PEZI|nr:hypothetical protein LTR77_001318 [Saxophila tyrrhenica]